MYVCVYRTFAYLKEHEFPNIREILSNKFYNAFNSIYYYIWSLENMYWKSIEFEIWM